MKRALVERRPWLLLSLLFGVSWWFVADSSIPGAFLIAWKGAGVGFLALYAFQRHLGIDGALASGMMALAAMGDMALELSAFAGGALFSLAHVVAIVVYARHRRARPVFSQKLFALALVLLVPVIAWFLSTGETGQGAITVYAALLAGMAAMAWTSRFRRYRVGLGALLFVLSDLVLFASTGAFAGAEWLGWLVWPFYYAGQLMIVTGIIVQLRAERTA